MGRIKRLNEGFAEDVSDGGFNSSNGVFKVTYIPYKDLSKPVGRDIFKNITPQSQYQIGDIVSAKTITNKSIEGAIVRMEKRVDNKGSVFFVKDTKTNKVHRINPYSIKMIQDNGNMVTKATLNTSVAKANTDAARYQNNPVALGSFESRNSKYKEVLNEIISSIDPSYRIKFGEEDGEENTIYLDSSLKENPVLRKKAEAQEIAHIVLSDTNLKSLEVFEALCDLWAIKKLQYIYAELSYKSIIIDFPEKHGVSYGEFADANLSLIEKYL